MASNMNAAPYYNFGQTTANPATKPSAMSNALGGSQYPAAGNPYGLYGGVATSYLGGAAVPRGAAGAAYVAPVSPSAPSGPLPAFVPPSYDASVNRAPPQPPPFTPTPYHYITPPTPATTQTPPALPPGYPSRAPASSTSQPGAATPPLSSAEQTYFMDDGEGGQNPYASSTQGSGSSADSGSTGVPGSISYGNPITAGVVAPPGDISALPASWQVPGGSNMTAAQAMSLLAQQQNLQGQYNQSNNVQLGLNASQQLAGLMNQRQAAIQDQGIASSQLGAQMYGNQLQNTLANAQLQSNLWQANVGLQGQSLGQLGTLLPYLNNAMGGS